MVEVPITSIEAVPEAKPKLLDKRLSASIYEVPVIYQLEDGYHVEYRYKVHGTYEVALAWMESLPIKPLFPMRAVFNEKDELVNVITRMVPQEATTC